MFARKTTLAAIPNIRMIISQRDHHVPWSMGHFLILHLVRTEEHFFLEKYNKFLHGIIYFILNLCLEIA